MIQFMRTTSILIFIFLSIIVLAQNNPAPFIGTNLQRGSNLRVLRLAVSCVGEYTQSVPGANDTEKVDEVLRQMKEWIAIINDMYGREYCVRFELIPDNLMRSIIYTDATTDPWPTMVGAGCQNNANILNIQATVIDNAIGISNYDISHVILGPAFGGGCAGGFKTGYSGGFDIPVTRHEMGHQFSQAHTINNGGNNNFEPENAGRSVHGGNTDPIAHSKSYHELANHLNTTEANTGTKIPTGNTIPTANAGTDKSIPISTPFTLIGMSTDPNIGDQLTYVWDQLDGGIAQSLPTIDDTQGALFSRLVPTINPSRTYPQINDLIAGNFATPLEVLPTQPRDINFRLTVNDHHKINYQGVVINASGINSDDVKITVVNNGGPFQVTSQSTAVNYTGGTNQTILWSVNGTNLAPINTQNVKISLSVDGGMTFPITLSNSTPNDGSELVNIPNINTTMARVKVEAIDNYFFAINAENFTINQNQGIAGLNVVVSDANTIVNERGQTDTYTLALLTNPTGTVTVTLVADAQTEISTDGINFAETRMVNFSNTNTQTITVRGKGDNLVEGPQIATITQSVTVTGDNANYPVGMQGQPVTVNVSDAQIPPIVGVDFDNPASTKSPMNWVRVSDLRNLTLTNLSLDDGTPTTIDLTTTATNCGVGGCGFNSGNITVPQHTQSLNPMKGVAYTRGTVTFTYSGLKNNTNYKIFLFGLGVFAPIDHNVTITGSGAPVNFQQSAMIGTLMINDQTSNTDLLVDFGKEITSTGDGMIVVTVTPNAGTTEMAFAGIGILEGATNCTAPNITGVTTTQPTCENQTGTIVVTANGNGTLEYSVDNGGNWQISSTFNNLVGGTYTVLARLQTNPACQSSYAQNPIVLDIPIACNNVCLEYDATGLPLAIPIPTTSDQTSVINVPANGTITDVNIKNLRGTHTWVSDLRFTLTSPQGTSVILFEGVCNDMDDFHISLDDAAAGAINCPISDMMTELPQQALSIFNGQNAMGNWTLRVEDLIAQDGGSLTGWTIEICGDLQVGDCPTTATVDANPIPNGLQQASILLQSKGTVPNGGNVTLMAGNAVELLGDISNQFTVELGGVLEAKTGGCQ